MLIDLAINPFDADVGHVVELASAAESRGATAIWCADHFSADIVGRSWSRDPFVCLAAMAAATEHVDLGVLVANMVNRHPAQLASAVNSLQSLAPGRVRLGVGSGASPGTRFAREHEAIGRTLDSATNRREQLVDYLAALRAVWDHASDFSSESVSFDGLAGVVDGVGVPPLIVGASSWRTIELALEHADGVNIRANPAMIEQLSRLGSCRPPGFEVSVLEQLVAWDEPAGATRWIDRMEALGVDRAIVGISPPHVAGRLDLLNF